MLRLFVLVVVGLYVALTGSVIGATRLQEAAVIRVMLGVPDAAQWNARFAPNGQYLALYSGSRSDVWLFDLQRGGEHTSLMSAGADFGIKDVDFSGDSTALVILGAQGGMIAYDTAAGEALASPAADGTVNDVAFSSRMIAVGQNGGVRFRDLNADDDTSAFVASGVDGSIINMMFSADSSLLAYSLDETVRVWDVGAGRQTRVMYDDHAAQIVLFTPDSRFLVTYGGNAILRLWNVETGRRAGMLRHYPIQSVAATSDDTVLVTGRAGPDNQIRLFDVTHGRTRYRVGGYTSALSPGGTQIATASGRFYRDGVYWSGSVLFAASEVWLWDVLTRAHRVVYRGQNHIVRLWFSPDGRRLAFVDEGGLLNVLEIG